MGEVKGWCMADHRCSFSSHSSSGKSVTQVMASALGSISFSSLAEAQPEPSHGIGGRLGPVHAEQQQVALLASHPLAELLQRLLREELGDRRLDALRADLEPGEPLGAEPLGEVLELIELAPGIAAAALGVQRHGSPAGLERLRERAERASREEISHVLQLQAEAQCPARPDRSGRWPRRT